jgi:hypothetical protein
MIIPVPATWPLPVAVVALISTVAASTLAIAALDAAVPLLVGALPLGAPPLFEPPAGRLAVEGWVSVALVTAQAVPPPAPRQTTASPAIRSLRSELERPPPEPVGGHGGGPHA